MTHGLSPATIHDLKHLRDGIQLALAPRAGEQGEGEVHSALEGVPAGGGFGAYGAAIGRLNTDLAFSDQLRHASTTLEAWFSIPRPFHWPLTLGYVSLDPKLRQIER